MTGSWKMMAGQHIHFSNDVPVWVRRGVIRREFFDVSITPEFRQWSLEVLGQSQGGEHWHWDHFMEEDEVSFVFYDPRHAVLFKTAWC